MKIGYIRVSTLDQNLERQRRELKKYKVDKIISDKASGKDINKNLEVLLSENTQNTHLKKGDELIVLSLDRLGRSLENNIKIINTLKEKGIKFQSIKENIIIDEENNDSMNEFIISIFSSVAELERSLIRERQREGIKAKQKRTKLYNEQARTKSKRLKNKTFRYDIKHKKRSYVIDKWEISQATYYNYRRDILK